ncbi:uncharacterized protein LOC126982518 [Eriocheir sinensis]|uniref:uncharacterized protein LOC126982518 n=1 Tax=Eriocheir sinensis TaxID=95602 RepID=UPI0021C8BB71|nr:uncharacterized protein LOC126982518 [Eriocheir sinensis]
MQGKSYLAWAIISLTVVQTARPAAGQEYTYSKYSCREMIPLHVTEVEWLMDREEQESKEETNHVSEPAESGGGGESGSNGTMTTTTTTTTTTRPPAPKPQIYQGNVDVKVLTSEQKYRRLKPLEVTLQTSEYINGFLLQARRAGQQQNVVGTFLSAPHRGEIINCNGSVGNAVVMETAPLRLANLTFTWMAPEADVGAIEFVASVLLEEGSQYQIFRSAQLELNLYPVSTRECAVAKSCFRYCMHNTSPECPAHEARYTATLEFLPKAAKKKTSVKITIGGQLADSNGYLAVGFSKDHLRLSEADLTVCYLQEDNVTMGVEHYLLKNMDYAPDLHLGEIQLESADVDGDYAWCTFRRPITGDDHNLLPLTEPHYYYYFWGTRNGNRIFLPPSWSIKRSDTLISTNDNLFNYVVYSAAQSRQAPYSVVAAAVLLVGVHVMCW